MTRAVFGCTLGAMVGASLGTAMGKWTRTTPLPSHEAACARAGGEWGPAFVRADGGVMRACVVDGEAVPLAPMGGP